MSFFRRRGIRFKEAKSWVLLQTARLASAVEEWSLRECGEPITYLSSSSIRKDEEARRRQQKKGIEVGPVGTWSCVEAGSSYRLAPGEGAPRLNWVHTRCKHLYIYLDHPNYGFMNIRIQTWFPYRIQIAPANGSVQTVQFSSVQTRFVQTRFHPLRKYCIFSSLQVAKSLRARVQGADSGYLE